MEMIEKINKLLVHSPECWLILPHPDQIWKMAHVAETCSMFQSPVFLN